MEVRRTVLALCLIAKELSVTPAVTSKPLYFKQSTEDRKTHSAAQVQEAPLISGGTDSAVTPLRLGSDSQMNISPPL